MPFKYRSGLHNVGSYQVSGYPFITGSAIDASDPSNGEIKVEFPTVAKSVTVINTGDTGLRVYFNAAIATNSWCPNGTLTYPDNAPLDGLHFITLSAMQDSVTFDVKCREIYVASTASGANDGAFELWAELTGIRNVEMFALTGSGLTTS